ncbi:MAG: arsenic resistance protein [Acidimicrobiia bacterium]|nr:arsenic resistance protein [Acidimicrobiia bacterium]
MTAVDVLERRQVLVYLAAVAVGLGLGTALSDAATRLEVLVWPALAVLLLVTFTQIPLARLPSAVRDVRFVGAVVAGNLVLMPAVVAVLLPLAPADTAVRVGIVLVLVAPCTDWYLTFTHLAGGDTNRALAVTPINLALQLLLLPVYVRLLTGEDVVGAVGFGSAVTVFTTLILVPLLLAWLLQRRAEGSPRAEHALTRAASLPVPLVAVVVLLVAITQVDAVEGSLDLLAPVALVFVGFLVAALVVGRILGGATRLDDGAKRSLMFSLGTRNSFVVLPFALALPEVWALATVVIVLQSLVELVGMTVYLRVVPALTGDRRSIGDPP